MVKFLKNLLLYISAFVPMYFLVLLKLVVEIINGNLSFNALNTINFVLLIVLILCGIFGLILNITLSGEKAKEIFVLKKENITDKHFLGYFSLFVFFAIPLEFEKVSVFCVIYAILIFIGVVYINNSLYYINPLLNILGYKFFDITYRDETGEIGTAKIFSRSDIRENKSYMARIKNIHFTFIESDKNHLNFPKE